MYLIIITNSNIWILKCFYFSLKYMNISLCTSKHINIPLCACRNTNKLISAIYLDIWILIYFDISLKYINLSLLTCRNTMDLINATHNLHYENFRYDWKDAHAIDQYSGWLQKTKGFYPWSFIQLQMQGAELFSCDWRG